MSDFQISDYLFDKECREIAQGAFDDVTAQNPGTDAADLSDDFDNWIHQTCDGHEWVIYNHKALMICAHCNTDAGEEFLADVGMPDNPTLYSIACRIVFGEMQSRAMSYLGDVLEEMK